MSDVRTALRCAVHPGRAAHDLCPCCDRPRCEDDIARYGERGCDACLVAAETRPRPSGVQRLIAAGLAGVPVAVIGGWIYSQYVEVATFSWLVPILIGVAGASATTTAWRGGGSTRPAIAIGVVAALCGTAFGFRLFPHGPHNPLHPWHTVGLPYLCAAIGAVVWPVVLGPPRRPRRSSRE